VGRGGVRGGEAGLRQNDMAWPVVSAEAGFARRRYTARSRVSALAESASHFPRPKNKADAFLACWLPAGQPGLRPRGKGTALSATKERSSPVSRGLGPGRA